MARIFRTDGTMNLREMHASKSDIARAGSTYQPLLFYMGNHVQ